LIVYTLRSKIVAMLVKDVMTKKVITATPSTRFTELVRLLIKKNISGLPIVNKKGKVVGVISEKDLFYRLFPSQEEFYKNIEYYTNRNNLEKETRAIVKLKAKDLMTKDIISIGKNDHILTACSLLLIYEIRRLPVINHGKLVGVVTTNDIYKNFLLTITKK